MKCRDYVSRFNRLRTEYALLLSVQRVPQREVLEIISEYPPKIHIKNRVVQKFFSFDLRCECIAIFFDSLREAVSAERNIRLREDFRTPRVQENVEKEITIPAGDTPLKAGPMLRELTSLGAKAFLNKGFISLKESFIVCSPGEAISAGKVSLLNSLGIKPIRKTLPFIGLISGQEVFRKRDLQEFIFEKNRLDEFFNRANLLMFEAQIPMPSVLLSKIMEAHGVFLTLNRIITRER